MLVWILLAAMTIGAIIALWGAYRARAARTILAEALVGAVIGGIFGVALDQSLNVPEPRTVNGEASHPSGAPSPPQALDTKTKDVGYQRLSLTNYAFSSAPAGPLEGGVRKCRVKDSGLWCQFWLTSNSETENRLSKYGFTPSGIRMWDDEGNEYQPKSMRVGSRPARSWRHAEIDLLRGIRTQGVLIFDYPSATSTKVGLLQLDVYRVGTLTTWRLAARNVPIERGS